MTEALELELERGSEKRGIVDRLNECILGPIAGRESSEESDPGEWYSWATTPNQRPLRMVAGYAWNITRGKVLQAHRYRDELVEYGRNQRENGFMSAPGDGWNATEQLTSTHCPQWETAYYGALWYGIKYGDEVLRREAEWFIACELFYWNEVDPVVDKRRTGRVVVACARAKGTERPGKPKPYIVEHETRNQAWRIANGMPRTDSRKNRKRLRYGTDCMNILPLCLDRGWKFPEFPVYAPPLMCKLNVWRNEAPEGLIIETQIVDAKRPMLVQNLAVEHTRYNLATGEVEMIR